MASERHYDLALFGATGFTGGLTAHYLAENGPAGLRWALVGRNQAKLEAVRDALETVRAAEVSLPDLVVADAADPAALAKVAESAKVVATTVGPYALYGEPVVAACAAAGTDYVDLTGEPEFVDRMWLGYDEEAKRSGARLVHCCGFDSIPHDLGAYFTVKQLPEGVPLMVNGYARVGGQFSGGSYHSAVNGFARARQTVSAARQRRQREQRPVGRKVGLAPVRVRRDGDLGGWVVPLPTIDGPVVRRSAAALDRYGPDFRYGHNAVAKHLSSVAAVAGGASVAFALAQLPPTRKLLLKKVPAPGEGPERRDPRQCLVQGHLRRRGRRQAGRDRGHRRRPRLHRDRQDAGRVGALPGLRRFAGDRRAGHHGPSDGRPTDCTPANRWYRVPRGRAIGPLRKFTKSLHYWHI